MNPFPTNSALCARAFLRGLPIAALQAVGILMVSRGNLWGVFVTAFAINYWWRENVRAVQQNLPVIPFATGAACGSVLMVWLFR